MIQRATDPNASRLNWRPAAAQAGEPVLAARSRTGHAWPFISRRDERPAAPRETGRAPTSQSSGS